MNNYIVNKIEIIYAIKWFIMNKFRGVKGLIVVWHFHENFHNCFQVRSRLPII